MRESWPICYSWDSVIQKCERDDERPTYHGLLHLSKRRWSIVRWWRFSLYLWQHLMCSPNVGWRKLPNSTLPKCTNWSYWLLHSKMILNIQGDFCQMHKSMKLLLSNASFSWPGITCLLKCYVRHFLCQNFMGLSLSTTSNWSKRGTFRRSWFSAKNLLLYSGKFFFDLLWFEDNLSYRCQIGLKWKTICLFSFETKVASVV